jgi:anaerobic selenocysteine-containing dehydrogenase
VKIQGHPDHPFTADLACGKVNRDMDLVYSPQRLTAPLRRTGPKGSGQFERVTWDAALDEIVARWRCIIAEWGKLVIPGYT